MMRSLLYTLRTAALACALVSTAGCRESKVDPAEACTPDADHADRSQPPHTLVIDNADDFGASERFEVGSAAGDPTPGYAAYATWDACTLFLGFEGEALGSDASAHRYLTLYLNIDPLGEGGVDDPKDHGVPRPKLPFHAEYFLELRTDGRTTYPDGGAQYHGNVQLYHARSDWGAGMLQEWKPMQPHGLQIGHGRAEGFVEVAIPRRLLDDPCAIEVVGWIVDEATNSNFAFWPPPLSSPSPKAAHGEPSGLVLTDSLTLNYWGFMLDDGQTPNARQNLNRTDYDDIGDCAYGPIDNS